jgi:sec-independent protein translocase protein TatB
MFGIDSGEFLVIAVVALVVIGPKDLPRVMRVIGQFVGRARGMAKQFRSGFDAMIHEAELEDMEKMWKANNDKIMREHPAPVGEEDWPEPVELPPPPAPRPRAARGPIAPPARGRAAPRAAPPPAATDEPPAGEAP